MFGRRRFWQIVSTLLSNGYWGFLWQRGLYRGWPKGICFPGLNCYSCPAATMACPLGSLQQSLASLRLMPGPAFQAVAYVLGTLLLFALVLGRIICGWLCPFGLLQEFIYRLPVGPKKIPPRRIRWVKYALLFSLVLFLPLTLTDITGYGKAWFCRLLCPAGTLEAGIFNLLLRPELRSLVGFLFYFKVFILALIIFLCLIYFRFFCVVLCPLGAFYGLWQRISLIRLHWEAQNCFDCRVCEEVCPVGLKIPEELNSAECIRCLQCLKACPSGGIRLEGPLNFIRQVDQPQRSAKKQGHA